MFPLLKPGHLPALGFTTQWLYYRQNATREGSYLEKPLSCSTWRWVWADFSLQRLLCPSSVAISHHLRVLDLRKSKQSNICKAQNIAGWPLCDSELRFQRQRATQGLVPFTQGCDRGKKNPEQTKPQHIWKLLPCWHNTAPFQPRKLSAFLAAPKCSDMHTAAISYASKKWSPSLGPGPRCQNPAVLLESLKSLDAESLTMIMCKHINASLGCHNHMKGRLKHVGESARSSRTKIWRFWLHIFVMNIIILVENVSLWPNFFPQLLWCTFMALGRVTESLRLQSRTGVPWGGHVTGH